MKDRVDVCKVVDAKYRIDQEKKMRKVDNALQQPESSRSGIS